MSRSPRFDLDELAHLEEERDFLLKSLDDLEAEWEARNVDEVDYQRLRDDYTARAAAVLRSIRDGIDTRSEPPPVSPARRVAVAAGVVGFGAAAAFLLAGALGERLPGQTITGNEQLRPEPAAAEVPVSPNGTGDLEALAAAVEADPGDGAARLAYADALLGAGDAPEALRQYDQAARLDPTDARSRTSGAMIVFQVGLVDEALERLDEAESADPTFADTFFFRGIVLFQGRGDAERAAEALSRYLELAPDGVYADDADIVLQELTRRR